MKGLKENDLVDSSGLNWTVKSLRCAVGRHRVNGRNVSTYIEELISVYFESGQHVDRWVDRWNPRLILSSDSVYVASDGKVLKVQTDEEEAEVVVYELSLTREDMDASGVEWKGTPHWGDHGDIVALESILDMNIFVLWSDPHRTRGQLFHPCRQSIDEQYSRCLFLEAAGWC